MYGCMDVWMDVPMYAWRYLCSIFVDSGAAERRGPGICPGQPASPCAEQGLAAHSASPPRGSEEPRVAPGATPDQAPPGRPIGQDRGKGVSFSIYPR